MPVIDICFLAQDPPDGRWVATKTMGTGKIHLVAEDGEGVLCGQDLTAMSIGRVRGELNTCHSDLCKRCLECNE